MNENPMLSRLIYVSTRKSTYSAIAIEKMLSSYKSINLGIDTTGVLLYSQDKFIQYLEGDANTLLSIYNTDKRNANHEKVSIISYGPIGQKAFSHRYIATRKFSSEELAFRTDMSVEDKKIIKQLLQGERQESSKVLCLLKKFFN